VVEENKRKRLQKNNGKMEELKGGDLEAKGGFLRMEALARFERKFGAWNGIGEENSGPITSPKPHHQGDEGPQ
jgi:hypothetical protein